MPLARDAGWGAAESGPPAPREKNRGHCLTWGLLALLLVLWQSQGRSAPCPVHIAVSCAGGAVTISIVSAEGIPVKADSSSLDDPPRLIFDLPDAVISAEQLRSFDVNAAGVDRVRIGQFQADPPIVRVVADTRGGAQAPEWTLRDGPSAAQTLLVLRAPGPRSLTLPTISSCGKEVLLRCVGAGAATMKVGKLLDPPRVYVDLSDAQVEGEHVEHFPEGLVAEVRIGQQTPQGERPVARLVVELRENAAHSVFTEGDDLMIAVGGEPWALPLPEYHGAGRLKGKRIVIDPGHGGKDVGAPGLLAGGSGGVVFEKDIVLDIGLRLAEVLKAEGARVVMTRSDDTYIGLRERAEVANKLQADALVSVHCNSCDNPDTLQGTSVYYDHAHSVALAGMVQQELLASLGTEDKGVRNANFAVIRRTRGPGILVETAFINHEDDRGRLLNPNLRERAARAVARGVIRFLNQAGEPEAAQK